MKPDRLSTSRLTSRSQTVIPKAVRQRLGLKPGDTIGYVVKGRIAEIARLEPRLVDDPFAAFTEWAGEADERAYEDL